MYQRVISELQSHDSLFHAEDIFRGSVPQWYERVRGNGIIDIEEEAQVECRRPTVLTVVGGKCQTPAAVLCQCVVLVFLTVFNVSRR